MGVTTMRGCTVVLRGFVPFLLLRVGGLTIAGAALSTGAVRLEQPWLLLLLLPIVLTASILARRFAVKQIVLCQRAAFLCPAALQARTVVFQRHRVDVEISRPPLIGGLLDIGDVTFTSEQTSVTVHEVAQVSLLEEWLRWA